MPDTPPDRPRRRRPAGKRAVVALAGLLWAALVVGPPLGFLRWRQGRLVELADPAVQADWDVFRADMQRQSGREGPVQRKVPKSPEPPERVWLRDYPGLAVTAWVTLVGVLGGFLGLAAAGSAAQNRPSGAGDDEEQHERDSEHTQQ